MFCFLITIFHLVLVNPAQATSLGLESSQGSESKSTTLTANGDFNKASDKTDAPKSKIFYWDLSADRSQSITNETDGSQVIDNTNAYTFGVGLESSESWLANLDYDTTNTPEEKLTSSGPRISLGKKIKYGTTPQKTKSSSSENSEDSDEPFTPSLRIDLGITQLNYIEDYSLTAKRPLRKKSISVSGRETIGQRSTDLTIKWLPLEWLTLKATPATYKYDKNVDLFLQFLNSHKAINAVSTGFSNSLSGFPSSTLLLEADFDFSKDWEADVSHQTSTAASDGTVSTANKILFIWSGIENWQIGLGLEKTDSPATSSDPASSDTLTLVTLGADF